MKALLLFCLTIALVSCKKTLPKGDADFQITRSRTYLALGDSYTFGEGLFIEESFPYQLTDELNKGGIKTEEPQIFAGTGWTTSLLLSAMRNYNLQGKYDFVTVLIGANDHYLKMSKETYRKEFSELVNIAVTYSIGGRANVYVISLPDWTVTPFGKLKNFPNAGKELEEFNRINKEEAFNASVNYIDITPGSRSADKDQSLTSIDSLHPSAKLYKEWVKALYPRIVANLN